MESVVLSGINSSNLSEKKRNMSFNIYYLNFSKVYEIAMMINNMVVSSIQRENSNIIEKFRKKTLSTEGSTEYLANIKAVIGSESGTTKTNSSKMIESLDVKTTKSLLLRRLLDKCTTIKNFEKCSEGDLVKLDSVKLNILNEENLRQFLILRRDALKGLSVEGMEVNNLVSSMLQDYSYVLCGKIETLNNEIDSDNIEAIVIKIPMEIENEFESKYKVDDLLIGHISLIGIYKGEVSEKFVNTNTFNYLMEHGTQQRLDGERVFSSSQPVTEPTTQLHQRFSDEKKFIFIDIIAIIQDVSFIEEELQQKLSWFKKLESFLSRWREKNE